MQRRKFIHIAAGTVATIGIGSNSKLAMSQTVVVRQSIEKFITSASNVAKLQTLFKEMRKLPASHPSSYFFQAAVHEFPDFDRFPNDPEYAYIQKIFNSDPKAASQLGYWDQCTHERKSAEDFIIWHRAYLYFFERHARKILDDPTFAMPYWNYQSGDTKAAQASRMLPEIFREKTFQNGDKNYLFSDGAPTRNLQNSGTFMSSKSVSIEDFMRMQNYFGQDGIPGFGTNGIDNTPHGSVHGAIGGWMGSVNTAGFDPVFWCHHANIDRLFNVWLASGKKYWSETLNKQEVDQWMDSVSYEFLDYDGKPISKNRRFFISQSNLDYRYDTDPVTIPLPLVKTVVNPNPNVSNKSILSLPADIKGFQEKSVGASTSSIRIAPNAATQTNIPLSKLIAPTPVGTVGTQTQALKTQNSSSRNFTVLDFFNVKKETSGGGIFAVFVGPDAEAAVDISSPAYVGQLSSFEAPRVGSNRQGAKYRFDISRQIAALPANKSLESLIVRIVPLSSVDSQSPALESERRAELSVGQIVVNALVGSTVPLR